MVPTENRPFQDNASKLFNNLLETIRNCGSRIFLRRGCTRLLLYFNTNKPHSFFFCRIPVVLENRRSSQWGCAPPAPSPLDPPLDKVAWFRTRRVLLGFIVVTLQERESSQLPCLSIETTFGISCVLLEII